MKTFTLLALAAAAQLAQAHTTVFNIWVNDKDQGLGNSADGYIRSPPNNNPITDVTSDAMSCNVNNAATAKTVKVQGGDKITFEWHHNDNSASDDIIDLSHLGPVMTYIAPTSSNGKGKAWVKLAEDGYNKATDTWAVETLVANKGKHSITLPDLKPGKYLLRPEIIALHEGNNIGGAQFYMECVQIQVTSSGTAALPQGVALPGYYKATAPGIHFDLYNGFTSYPIPGPKVWNGKSSGSPSSSSKTKTATKSSTTKKATKTKASTTVAAPTTVPVTTTAKPKTKTAKPTTFSSVVVPSSSSGCSSSTPSPTGSSGQAVAKYNQCGGVNWTGSTTCAEGSACKLWNKYYAQCV